MTDFPSSAGGTYPSPPEEDEAVAYFAGLPSKPRLVGRTASIPWTPHRGMWRYNQRKQLGTVVDHKLNTAWEYDVAPRILACLDELGALWTSADIVRIEIVDRSHAPVVLWIGVKPGSLAGKDAVVAAYRCLDILEASGITDVDVEFRESLFNRSAGPALLPPAGWLDDPIMSVRHPLTHALSLPISSSATPQVAGTGGLFLSTGPSSSPFLLLTAQHAVLPPGNTLEDEVGPAVLSPGDAAYENCIAAIRNEIETQVFAAEEQDRRIVLLDQGPPAPADLRRDAVHAANKARSSIEKLHALFADVDLHWAASSARLLGTVAYAPPVRVNTEGYIEDYALIKVEEGKIDKATFTGNNIDLCTLTVHEFLRKMFPSERGRSVDKYPLDRLVTLTRILSDHELRHPTTVDENGAPCMVVLKDGAATGLTIGRASGIMSFVREYADDETHRTFKAWAILPYDQEAGSFSAPGDSGAIVVDGVGSIGGMIVGGAGTTAEQSDITYATPYTVIEKSIKSKYPDARLYGQA